MMYKYYSNNFVSYRFCQCVFVIFYELANLATSSICLQGISLSNCIILPKMFSIFHLVDMNLKLYLIPHRNLGLGNPIC